MYRQLFLRKVLLIIVFLITFQNFNYSQSLVDTLYRHPDTTTFNDNTITVVGDVTNLAVRYQVSNTWESFYIDKIIFVQPSGVDQTGFVYFFISTGEQPEDSIITEKKVYLNNPVFPNTVVVELDTPVHLCGTDKFYLSGSIFNIISISEYFEQGIKEQYAFRFTLQLWIEDVPVYFNLGIVVRNDLTSVKDNNHSPEKFKIYQNYPNPFNPVTKIKYAIPGVVDEYIRPLHNVTLIVYDILGNKVATLVNEPKAPGIYEVEFNASNLSSGVYFYTLRSTPTGGQAGEFISSKKMLLLK